MLHSGEKHMNASTITTSRDATYYMVKHALMHARSFTWTRRSNNFSLAIQPGVTISVFDSRYRHRDGRTVHSHDSDFHSRIVAGVMRNTRYTEVPSDAEGAVACRHLRIDTMRAAVADAPDRMFLLAGPEEVYTAGDEYDMLAPEMHRAAPDDGTVTIRIKRYVSQKSGVHVCWLPGDGPEGPLKVEGNLRSVNYLVAQPPTPAELDDAVGNALQNWF